MSFKKKVWLNVPDINNLPDIPKGQDALARFDADNMNRIEDGIEEVFTSINTLINNVYLSPLSIIRDKDGTMLTDVISMDGSTEVYTSGDGSGKRILAPGKTESLLSHNFNIPLIGYQPHLEILVKWVSPIISGSASTGYIDICFSISDDTGYINKFNSTRFFINSDNNTISITLSEAEVQYLFDNKPTLTLDMYLKNNASSNQYINSEYGTVFNVGLSNICYLEARRCEIFSK